MNQILSVVVGILFVCSGCAWFESKEEKPAQELASDGMDAFKSGDYKDAVESFEKLRDFYPFSKYAILAELKIADSHYHLGAYEEAVFAYEEFVNLHPRNEAVPYALYQIGLCHFEQIDTVDRDSLAAKRALDAFRRLQKQFPRDVYAKKADEHIKKCIKSLAGHDFYVGVFYYKSKRYRSALNRFKRIISEYPDVGIHQKALEYITLCEEALKKAPEKQEKMK
jgi:outer membrane protein assembly factor BamD